MTPSTKIDLNHNKIARIDGLDELAAVLFPGNKTHQKLFLAIFVEIKYSDGSFLSSLSFLPDKYGFSGRTLGSVRAKMRRMGLIDHVCRFNKSHGYREGWVFSGRFQRSLGRLEELWLRFREHKDGNQEKKDRDLFKYL
jgi:hypothetical protein